MLKGTYNDLVEAWLILPQRSEEAERLESHIVCDENAALARAYNISEDGLVLVRPDGYIGFLRVIEYNRENELVRELVSTRPEVTDGRVHSARSEGVS